MMLKRLALFAALAASHVAHAQDTSTTETTPPPENPDQKGKFNAGAQARFPSGPDEMGTYGSFHWIAVDLKGRYNVTDFLATYMTVPLAVKKPDLPDTQPQPSLIGGFTARGEAGLGKTLGLGVTLGVMRDGAFLLSEKDYPYFHGGMKPGGAIGPYLKLDALGLKITTAPQVVYQTGTGAAAQVPLSASLELGKLLKVAADAGVYTGKDFSLSADEGASIYAGGSIDIKIGPIITHLGAGVASLLVSDAMTAKYHSIGESLYVDVNVKYAK